MKANLLLLITLISSITSRKPNINFNIIDITDDRDSIDNNNNNKVILFYYPWDISYQTFLPEYIKVAFYYNELNATKVHFYKVDCSIDKDIADSFDVPSFPSVLFIKDMNKYFNQNEQLSEDLIYYLTIAIDGPILSFDSIQDIKAFLPWNSHLLINTLPMGKDNEKENDIFEKFALSYNTIPIYYIKCHSENCIRGYHYNKLVYVRNLDNDIDINYYNSTVSTDALYNFIWKYSFKPCALISPLSINLIFSSVNRSFLFYFRDEYNRIHTFKDYLIQNLTKENIHKLSSYAISPQLDSIHESIAFIFNVSFKSLPQIMLMHINTTEVLYYSMKINSSEDISLESLRKFYHDCNKGITKPILRSEPVPKESEMYNPIKIVGQTYRFIVQQRSKPILLLFYETNCNICGKLMLIWDELAKNYGNIDIAYFDIKLNTIEGLTISSPPIIYFFTQTISDMPIKYKKDFNYDSIKEWLLVQLYKEKIYKKKQKIENFDDL